VTGIGGIGRTIGIYLAGYLYNGFGQHYDGWGFHEGAIFYVFICGLTLSIIPIHFLIPKDSQIFQKKKIMEKEEIMEKGEITEKKDNADKKEILLKQGYRSESDNSRLFSIFLLGLALINFGRGAFYVIFSQYLELTNGLNCPNTLISQILSLHSVVIIITGFTSGRVLKIMKPGNLFILNSILLMIYIWLAVFTSTLLVIYIVVILWGITSVLLSITSYIYVSVLIPTKTRGKMFAWYNFSISVASGIFGPFFAGFLVDLLLSEGYIDVQAYKITFFLSSLVSLLGLTLIVILESKRRYISFQENIDLS
jgi:MFS family permease